MVGTIINNLLDFLLEFEVHEPKNMQQVFKILDSISDHVAILCKIFLSKTRYNKTLTSNIEVTGPLTEVQNYYKLLDGRCLVLRGSVKYILRQRELRIGGSTLRKSKFLKKDKNQIVMDSYLKKLSLRIEKDTAPT
jgi:hypothetical protein